MLARGVNAHACVLRLPYRSFLSSLIGDITSLLLGHGGAGSRISPHTYGIMDRKNG